MVGHPQPLEPEVEKGAHWKRPHTLLVQRTPEKQKPPTLKLAEPLLLLNDLPLAKAKRKPQEHPVGPRPASLLEKPFHDAFRFKEPLKKVRITAA